MRRPCSPACSGRRMEPTATVEAMCSAAAAGHLPELRRLLAANPGLAADTDSYGRTPLGRAAAAGKADAVRLLLGAAPAAALTADAEGRLPLHVAACWGRANAVRLLLEAAPTVATRRTTDLDGRLPLEMALSLLAYSMWVHAQAHAQARFLETARLLLPATPPEDALSALGNAGQVALPLYADLAACAALSPGQWQRMPSRCSALAAALPAVLARSAAEAALLVRRLPAEVRQRLCVAALCLGRAQKELQIDLPAALVGQVLALAAGP